MCRGCALCAATKEERDEHAAKVDAARAARPRVEAEETRARMLLWSPPTVLHAPPPGEARAAQGVTGAGLFKGCVWCALGNVVDGEHQNAACSCAATSHYWRRGGICATVLPSQIANITRFQHPHCFFRVIHHTTISLPASIQAQQPEHCRQTTASKSPRPASFLPCHHLRSSRPQRQR